MKVLGSRVEGTSLRGLFHAIKTMSDERGVRRDGSCIWRIGQ